jgi:predicted metalloendopeptidase
MKLSCDFPFKNLVHRWNMCVEWTNKKMGMAVGSLFVQDHFNHESKVVALEMIHGIREGDCACSVPLFSKTIH